MRFNQSLEALINNLKKLPGVGDKTALRYAMHLISINNDQSLQLAEAIKNAVDKHRNCSQCNTLTDIEPCCVCSQTGRDRRLLCVVESTSDVYLLENTNDYNGYYFVLGHLLSPIDGYGIEEIKLPQLLEKAAAEEVEEIILALNPSTEGETTINLIASEINKLNKRVTRLSTGLPFGGNIEYSSAVTLSNAIKRRYPITDSMS